MRILTDAPAAAVLAAPAEPWRAPPQDLAAEAAALWGTFGADAPPRYARSASPGDRWLLVLDDVPRSQFDLLNERLADGTDLPDGLACVALAGSRFRGQRGRVWSALRGNLHLSVHLALDLDAAASQVGLTLLPAVATARAVETTSGGRLRPGVKWVNDLLLGGRKVAGVLTSTQVQGDRVRHAVVGIGANVALAPSLSPSPRAVPAGSLAELDAAFGVPDAWATLLLALLDELERGRRALLRGDAASLFDAYRERAAFLGRVVTIWPVDEGPDPGSVVPLAHGRVLALLPDLSLAIEGVARPVHGGRMTVEP